MNKQSILDNPTALRQTLSSWGEPPFRATQIENWALRGATFEDMRNIPMQLRQKLNEHFLPCPAAIIKIHKSNDETTKHLFALPDGQKVEAVLMRYRHGNTLCVSTQAGCRMGCVFCASTVGGLARDLTPGEMLGQVIMACADIRGESKELRQITNLVLMGMGEPLENLENCLSFINQTTEQFGISPRNISLSTCGLPEGIRQLTKTNLPITLCWSLHAPDDALRKKLMPGAAARATVAEVFAALREHIAQTKRRIIVEYTLIDGVNDAPVHAQQAIKLLRGMMCHVNIIPYNPVPGKPFRPSPPHKQKQFLAALTQGGLSATARRTLGDDINAACGQLRRS
ncbi:MAG: 23S rRNA (adenine(2503)-C(2))-methyltransferase RlmN [Clostridia bacterium]|nr:23S rRNA (adenine(2503)-C(2))-methyltransferase RlmN [Clostridia bacterium]